MQVAAVVENGHQATIKLVDNKCRYDISCERKGKLKHDEELHTFSSFWNWVHLEILNLEKLSKKDILPCIYSCTVCMLLASRPHATQFSQLQRVNCDSLLGLWYLLPYQVDQFLLHWQKAIDPWEGQLTCQTGCSPMESGIFSVSQDGVFPFLVETYTLPAFCSEIPECHSLLSNLLMQVFIKLSN